MLDYFLFLIRGFVEIRPTLRYICIQNISIYSRLLVIVYSYSEGKITKLYFEVYINKYLLNHRVTSSLLHREVKTTP